MHENSNPHSLHVSACLQFTHVVNDESVTDIIMIASEVSLVIISSNYFYMPMLFEIWTID